MPQSHGINWVGALVHNGVDGCEGLVDAGTSTNENGHVGSPNLVDSYQLGRFILVLHQVE